MVSWSAKINGNRVRGLVWFVLIYLMLRDTLRGEAEWRISRLR